MMKRREFGMAGLSALALATVPRVSSAADAKKDDDHEHGHGGPYADCADACADCQLECDACANHCTMLLADGKKEHLATLQTCLDCADVCSAAARIVARQGAFSSVICTACAEACAKCATACEKFTGDKMMTQCAKECRACEKACKEMVKQAK